MAKKEAPKHVLIPKHKKLSEKEKKELLAKYNITVKELPSITSKDPAIRNMDLETGDVVKIERSSITAGNTVYYRSIID
ncbi:DNA-directed RNA polymerase subunit H [Candidatus Woesearchaeota archaeon]|jgi:DNA-directed RNA polymerase subunit H|nr:DNA-directed RNA polymerase subunit H [Candidatus Woesearchaeota archaeon]